MSSGCDFYLVSHGILVKLTSPLTTSVSSFLNVGFNNNFVFWKSQLFAFEGKRAKVLNALLIHDIFSVLEPEIISKFSKISTLLQSLLSITLISSSCLDFFYHRFVFFYSWKSCKWNNTVCALLYLISFTRMCDLLKLPEYNIDRCCIVLCYFIRANFKICRIDWYHRNLK